jgi:hypothetical protein
MGYKGKPQQDKGKPQQGQGKPQQGQGKPQQGQGKPQQGQGKPQQGQGKPQQGQGKPQKGKKDKGNKQGKLPQSRMTPEVQKKIDNILFLKLAPSDFLNKILINIRKNINVAHDYILGNKDQGTTASDIKSDDPLSSNFNYKTKIDKIKNMMREILIGTDPLYANQRETFRKVIKLLILLSAFLSTNLYKDGVKIFKDLYLTELGKVNSSSANFQMFKFSFLFISKLFIKTFTDNSADVQKLAIGAKENKDKIDKFLNTPLGEEKTIASFFINKALEGLIDASKIGSISDIVPRKIPDHVLAQIIKFNQNLIVIVDFILRYLKFEKINIITGNENELLICKSFDKHNKNKTVSELPIKNTGNFSRMVNTKIIEDKYGLILPFITTSLDNISLNLANDTTGSRFIENKIILANMLSSLTIDIIHFDRKTSQQNKCSVQFIERDLLFSIKLMELGSKLYESTAYTLKNDNILSMSEEIVKMIKIDKFLLFKK